MALTLNNTIAAEDANSYVDAAYCDAYWEQHYSSVKAAQWSAMQPTQKVSVLLQACRVLETLRFTVPVSSRETYGLTYDRRSKTVLSLDVEDVVPTKSSYIQVLQFPRNLDRESTTGDFFIPEGVMMAQCEQAIYLVNYDETAVANRLQGVESDSLTAGQVKLTQTYVSAGTALAPMAVEFLKPFFIKNSSILRRA